MGAGPVRAWPWKALVLVTALVMAVPALAQAIAPATQATPLEAGTFQPSEVLTFLFLAIGPSHVIPGFAELAARRDRRFKTKLALYGTLAAALAIAIAATIGMHFLQTWHLSIPALAGTAGLLLLLVALKHLLAGQMENSALPAASVSPPPKAVGLAFSPLAVPIIVPPFGMAVVILLLALAEQSGAMSTMIGLVAIMLAIDFVAMMTAEQILRIAVLRYGMTLAMTMIGVLQVALAVQTIVHAIHNFNIE